MTVKMRRAMRVQLRNRGQLSLLFLGTGSAFAKTLNQNNLLIVKGEDHLLVDCGTKCTQALYDLGVAVPEVRNFLITHSHADHIGGLEEIMMTARYIARSLPTMVITEEYERILWEESLKGGAAHSETGLLLQFSNFWHINRPRLLKHYPRETWEADIGSINIKMPRTMHIPDRARSWKDAFWSCGVIIDDRVFYTSDTRFDPALLFDFDEIFDFEVIFHDCQFFMGGVHCSLEELATLPAALKRKIVLMHYDDRWKEQQAAAAEAGFRHFAKQGTFYDFDEPCENEQD